MDKFNELTTGAKLVLGAAIVFLIVSFFSWFDYGGPGEDELDAIGADTGITMWHGVGWIAGLIAIGLIVWQALRGRCHRWSGCRTSRSGSQTATQSPSNPELPDS